MPVTLEELYEDFTLLLIDAEMEFNRAESLEECEVLGNRVRFYGSTLYYLTQLLEQKAQEDENQASQ